MMPPPNAWTEDAAALSMTAIAALGEPVAVFAAGGHLVSANPACQQDPSLVRDGTLTPAVAEAAAALLGAGGGRRRVKCQDGEGIDRVFDLMVLALDGTPPRGLLVAQDHTVESGLRNALAESRARYKNMVEVASDSAWEVGADGTFTYVAPRGLAGYEPCDLIGRPAETMVDAERHSEPVIAFLTPAPLDRSTVWMTGANGGAVCLEVSAVPLYDAKGEWRGARGCCRDITDRHHRQAELAEARARERVLARIIRLFRREAEPENMIQAAASAITHGLGGTGCQIFGIGAPLARVITRPTFHVEASFGRVVERGDGRDALLSGLAAAGLDQVVGHSLDGHPVLATVCEHGGRVNGAILVFRDDGRRAFVPSDESLLGAIAGQLGVALEQLYKHRALLIVSRSDGLTGLLNRRAFYEEMTRRIRRLARGEHRAALMYVDLDNFKHVNDTRGHKVGDEVLVRVAEILRGNTRSTDMVARLGGDEYAVWLDDADATVAAKRAEVFLAAAGVLRKYSGSPDRPLMLSIGVAVYDPSFGEDVNTFVSRADAAMYAIKRRGKGSYGIAPPPRSDTGPRGSTTANRGTMA
jgi:diguanylate cyclase (GGDEF)-like protein/PAS domain S-box-containing protein